MDYADMRYPRDRKAARFDTFTTATLVRMRNGIDSIEHRYAWPQLSTLWTDLCHTINVRLSAQGVTHWRKLTHNDHIAMTEKGEIA